MIFSEKNKLAECLRLPLGERPSKPRGAGFTMVIDKGMGFSELEDLLETSAPFIDYLKFGFGTAILYPSVLLGRKLQLAKVYGVKTCIGGTLSEIAMVQGKFEELVKRAVDVGFTAVEVSDGTIHLNADVRKNAIRAVSNMTTVLSEVGKKLEDFPAPKAVVDQITSDLEAGAELVIVEGRESGEGVGIYGESGAVSEDLLNQIIRLLPKDVLSKIMWEAPKKAQQVELIRRFGREVSLGNIAPIDVLSLESLRLGLRGDTFVWSLSPRETQ